MRTLSSGVNNALLQAQNQPQGTRLTQKRLFSAAAAACAPTGAAQPAPDPKAYLASGVVKPKQSVDVKKVLVIGSGGLAIGQAGEFDYSGMFTPFALLLKAVSHHESRDKAPMIVNADH